MEALDKVRKALDTYLSDDNESKWFVDELEVQSLKDLQEDTLNIDDLNSDISSNVADDENVTLQAKCFTMTALRYSLAFKQAVARRYLTSNNNSRNATASRVQQDLYKKEMKKLAEITIGDIERGVNE